MAGERKLRRGKESPDPNRPEILRFRFTPVDPPVGDEDNPHSKQSTDVPDVIEALAQRFEGAILEVELYANEHTVLVKKELIADICSYLKGKPGFDYLADLGGIDRFTEQERFEVFYNLVSIEGRKRIRLKVRVDESDLQVPSVTPVHRSANWNERECWDMFGIGFDGHPDHRRMYMPEDFEYHPLRKEFPVLGIPGSLPLPTSEPDGRGTTDPYPAAHGRKAR